MTINVANTTLTNTFEYFVNRTNELANAISTKVVTTDSNTTSGNAAITGTFSANVYIVGNSASNTSISAPNTEQKSSGEYFLNANGSWTRASILANSGIIANSSGIFVNANTGIVANASGVFVDSTYITTLTANNATRLGGVVAASYVQNTDSRTLSGNLIFSGANINFTGAKFEVVAVTAGAWNGTTIATNKGGTGQTTYTDGQLLIGNTSSGSLQKATLTAANNITVTNGAGSISIAADPDLSYVSAALSGTVDISGSGTSATIPAANNTIAGLMTNGTQTIAGVKTFSSTISGSINGNADTVTDGVYLSDTQIITGNKTFTGTLTVNGALTGTIIATQAQAEAGTSSAVIMTPLRVAQAIDAQVPAPTASQVGSATAGLSASAVGTYAILFADTTTTAFTRGTNYAGSLFNTMSLGFDDDSSYGGLVSASGPSPLFTPSGTWKALQSSSTSGSRHDGGLFLRVS